MTRLQLVHAASHRAYEEIDNVSKLNEAEFETFHGMSDEHSIYYLALKYLTDAFSELKAERY